MPEGTTFLGVVIKQVVLGASAFAIGVLLYRTLVFERRRRRPWLYLVALLCIAIGFLGDATRGKR
jgi:hypothetical protein